MKSISQMRKTRTITRSRFPELLKCDELTTSPFSNCHLHSRFILDDGSQIGWQNGGLLRSGERGKNSSVCLLNQVGSAVAGRRVKSQSSRLNTIMQEGGTVLSRWAINWSSCRGEVTKQKSCSNSISLPIEDTPSGRGRAQEAGHRFSPPPFCL